MMKLIGAFLQLIRSTNLFFIALTQILYYAFIFSPLNGSSPYSIFIDVDFLFLMTASVCIAAAGYVINDYFDVQIDRTNKPEKVIVDTVIKRRWAIVWHLLLSGIGLLLTAVVSYNKQKWYLLLFNIISVLLLWLYSTTFKKKLLSGNWIISTLTAWVILVMYLYLEKGYNNQYIWFSDEKVWDAQKFFKLTIVYSGFAFVMTLIREAVKDMEDLPGDAQFGCATMPVRWGVPVSKMYTGVWLIVTIASLVLLEIYAYQAGRLLLALYCNFLLVLPLLFCLKWLYRAQLTADYHYISNWLKLVMLAGILSMIFFA